MPPVLHHSSTPHQLASVNNQNTQAVPPNAFLTFPPFPSPPPGIIVESFSRYQATGVWIPKPGQPPKTENKFVESSPRQEIDKDDILDRTPHDAHDICLVEVDPEVDAATQASDAKAKRARRLQNSKLATRVEKEDCWKIGEEGVVWEEPDGTSRSDYHV